MLSKLKLNQLYFKDTQFANKYRIDPVRAIWVSR